MKYALIGKTLSHSYSKIIHRSFGKYDYELVPLKENDVSNFVEKSLYDGFNVTIPYKKTIMGFCDYICPKAQKIGCVNTVVKRNGKLCGYNTDYDGFSALAKKAGISFKNKRVAILGSGGTFLTAKAVALDEGASEIIPVSRNGKFNYDNQKLWQEVQIIVNTTPVGMFQNNGETLLNIKDFQNLQGVIDVIYNPNKTKLVYEAEKLGIHATGGLYMLVYQAKCAYEIFLDSKLDDSKTDEVYLNLNKAMTNIVLIGMPGCGKSTIGKKIAEITGKEFIDTDNEIIKKVGMSIPEIFERKGEEYFRKLEAEVAMDVGKLQNTVIATGGGIIKTPENEYSLKQNGKIYHIIRDINSLDTKGRPLSTNIEGIKEMEKERMPIYKKWADETIYNDKDINNFIF